MSNRVRVLVVDDSALMRKLIPQILARTATLKWSARPWTALWTQENRNPQT